MGVNVDSWCFHVLEVVRRTYVCDWNVHTHMFIQSVQFSYRDVIVWCHQSPFLWFICAVAWRLIELHVYEVLIGHCLSTRQDLCVLTQVMLSVCPQYGSECNTWFIPSSAYRMLSTDYYRSNQHFVLARPKYIHFYNITNSDTGIVLVSVRFYKANKYSEATCAFYWRHHFLSLCLIFVISGIL